MERVAAPSSSIFDLEKRKPDPCPDVCVCVRARAGRGVGRLGGSQNELKEGGRVGSHNKAKEGGCVESRQLPLGKAYTHGSGFMV